MSSDCTRFSYDVSALPAEDGVSVSIHMVDEVDDVSKDVHLGCFPDHELAAEAASAWVKTDLETFADLDGARTPRGAH